MALRYSSSDLTRALAVRCAWVGLALGCSGEGAADETLSNGGADSETGGSTGSTAPGESEVAQAMVDAHNAVRRSLDDAQPDVAWSGALASYAGQWADELARGCGGLRHRDQNRYGENIAMRGSSRLVEAFNPEEAVAGWAAEAACWDFGTIRGSERCDARCVAELNSNGCGHYTQLIWGNTERIGCGYATCESAAFQYEIWVCNYDPPGNFIGQTPY
jgi:pathogenesis-related protein 1